MDQKVKEAYLKELEIKPTRSSESNTLSKSCASIFLFVLIAFLVITYYAMNDLLARM